MIRKCAMFLCLAAAVHAQVAVTGNVKTLAGQAPGANVKIQATLQGCDSKDATVPGQFLGLDRSPYVFADATTGAFSFAAFRGNDVIKCNDQANVTYWTISIIKSGTSTPSWTANYIINEADGAANLNTKAKMTTAPLPSVLDYAVRNQDNTFSKVNDFAGATVTRPFRRLAFASFPATCTAGKDMLIRTDPATAGQVLYLCNATGNGWNLVGDGGGGGGSPGGVNMACQFNDSGSFGGVDGCKFDKVIQLLTIKSGGLKAVAPDYYDLSDQIGFLGNMDAVWPNEFNFTNPVLGIGEHLRTCAVVDGCNPAFPWHQPRVLIQNPFMEDAQYGGNLLYGYFRNEFSGQLLNNPGPFSITMGMFPNPGNPARMNNTVNIGLNCGRGMGNLVNSDNAMCDGFEGNWQASDSTHTSNERHFGQWLAFRTNKNGVDMGAGYLQRPMSWYHEIDRVTRISTSDSMIFNVDNYNFGTSGNPPDGNPANSPAIDYHLMSSAGVWEFKYATRFLRGLKLNPTGVSQPTCDSSNRGLVWATQGGAGVADKKEICDKNSDGTYSWKDKAATATALAANPTDCSAGQYATTIDASGNLSCAQVGAAQISGLAAIASSGSASDLIAGTVPDARFPGTLPAASGVNLTNLNATNLASGTVNNARLSAQVPLTNQSNTYSAGAKQIFDADATSADIRLIGGTADPSSLTAGDVWYRSDTNLFFGRSGTSTKQFAFTDSNITGTAAAFAANGANCGGNNFALGVDAAGGAECAQPAFSNLSGSIAAGQIGADAIDAATDLATTLCSNGQILKKVAGVWACAADDTGAGGGYATIQEEGSGLTQRGTLNFIGNAITAADNAGNTRTDVTLSQSPSGSTSVVGTGRTLTAGTGIATIGDLSADRTIGLKYSDTLAGNPALNAKELVFSTETGSGCILAEGTTADTQEQLYCFPAGNGNDVTNYIALGDSSGVATTALALNTNPTDCSANRFATTIDASGNLTCAQVDVSTSAVTGTLAVGNGGTGITSIGSGVATWWGTPSSANLATALTDETGSGLAVFGTSPTLSTPTLNGNTVIAGPSSGNTRGANDEIIQIRRHATDCTAITDGKAGEQCWEEDADAMYVCEPSAGDCDTAGEWKAVGGAGSAYATIKNNAGTSQTQRTTFIARDYLDASDDSGNSRTNLDVRPDQTVFMLVDDFIPTGNGTGTIGQTGFSVPCDFGGCPTYSAQAGLVQHPGVIRVASAAATGDSISLRYGASSVLNHIHGLTNLATWEVYWIGKMSRTTNIRVRYGLGDDSGSAQPANGLWIGYDTVLSDANFTAECRGGGNSSRTSLGVAADTNYHTFRIWSTTAGTISFSIDGGTTTTISTNCPATSVIMGPQITGDSRTTSSAYVEVDYFSMKIRGLSR